MKETINIEELLEEAPPDTTTPQYQIQIEANTTKGLTEEQKQIIKQRINKMRAIIEIDNKEEEEQEKKKYNDNMREHLRTMMSEEGEDETFNNKNQNTSK